MLRSVIKIDEGKFFGVMPGSLNGPENVFGAKLVGVFPDPIESGRQRHNGIVVLFDSENGALLCVAEAETITAIRTAAATAVAPEALAREDARRLAIFGYGTQARHHVIALSGVRKYESITIWGRDSAKAQSFARELSDRVGLEIGVSASAADAARESDVICTVTTSSDPILHGAWIQPGTHINAVGSSIAGPVEIDNDLVERSRYFVDSKPSALAQAAEFLSAQAAGLVDASHIVGEIGKVLAGTVSGRRDASEITLYKSLGHIVQDLAAVRYLAAPAQMASTTNAVSPFEIS